METPPFARCADCSRCPLGATARTICIGTRPFRYGGRTKALLVVGDFPGHHEDQQGSCFAGPAGKLLEGLFLEPGASRPSLWRFSDYADIYLTNAIRCAPPGELKPNKSHLKACRPYFLADLQALQARYSEVVILCSGTYASQFVIGKKIETAFKHQPAVVALDGCAPVRAFCSYSTGILFKRRDPAKASAICDHLLLFRDYLSGARVWSIGGEDNYPQDLPPPADVDWRYLYLDIETYGSIEGLPAQTQFHPVKSELIDKCPKDQLIQTCALSWQTLGGELSATSFAVSRPNSLKKLWTWLACLRKHKGTLVGMNIKFDLMYLRHVYPWAGATWLNHDLPLLDISVLNYLHNELRPEKSLKALSRLFGISEYRRTLADGTFSSVDDPALHRYNIEDCLVSCKLHHLLEARIAEVYGAEHPKLTPYCRKWYSDLLWTAIYMSEDGVAVNRDQLLPLLASHEAEMTRLIVDYQQQHGEPLCGKGSHKTINNLMLRAAQECALLPDGLNARAALKRTEKTKAISANAENRNILLKVLPPTAPVTLQLQHYQAFKDEEKLVTSYLRPRLVGGAPKESSSLILNGLVYPDWYPVPGFTKDEEGSEGGTIQCRITCKRPAVQTDPPELKAALTSRFRPGFLLAADESQIELRVGGWLSHDPVFRAVYEADKDLHEDTARLIFGVEHPEPWQRQVAKQINFAMLFRGGAQKLHDTIMMRCGFDFPVHECVKAIQTFFNAHPVLDRWQNGLLEYAVKHGFVNVPLVGATRLFAGDRKTLLTTYTNTIVNLPVQATAACLLESAQGALIRELKRLRMRSVCSLQIYDALYVDGPLAELETVKRLVAKYTLKPPFYDDLAAYLGTEFPMKCPIKVQTWA